MIRLMHVRDGERIPGVFHGAGRLKKEKNLLQAKRAHFQRLITEPGTGHGFDSAWWKAAKPLLRLEADGKCAYCEARADAVAYCDVEHFRPKAVWWWLTCCWDNFLFACQLCNQQSKGEKFPLSGQPSASPVALAHDTPDTELALMIGRLSPDPLDEQALEAHTIRLKREKGHFIDPYAMDPEEFIAYEADDVIGQVKVIPRTSTAAVKRTVNASIEGYGLNREELCELRYETYEALDLAREALEESAMTEAKKIKIRNRLKRYVNRRRAFAGMSRYFLIDAWKLLPPETREE
jgi:hypothetical protein